MMTIVRRMAACAAAALMVAGCASAGPAAGGPTPSGTTTTAIQGWERYFRMDWSAQQKAAGREIDGYIYNLYGAGALRVQLLAQGLDQSGNVVGQKIEWVQGGVPALNRAYFRVAGLPPANTYRVSVWAFDFVEGTFEHR